MMTLSFRHITSGIIGGIILSLLNLPFAISSASLVFSGDLAPHIAAGSGMLLIGFAITLIMIGLGSSHPGMFSSARASQMPLFALMASAISLGMTQEGDTTLLIPTLTTAIALSAVLSGIFLFVLGCLQLGSMVRYIPYPVIGGFFAGVGYLLSKGALDVMFFLKWDALNTDPTLLLDALQHWLPGLLLAVTMLILPRFFNHWLLLPSILMIFILGFHGQILRCGTLRVGI